MVPKPVLVLGIGNVLLGDEGIGIVTLAHLANSPNLPPGLELIDAGTPSFALLPRLTLAWGLVVIDAAHFDAPPGSVRLLEGEAMDEHLRASRRSAHEVGMADLLDMARLLEALPPRRALIGIRIAQWAWGEGVQPALLPAVPRAARMVGEVVARWGPTPNGAR